MGHGYYNVTNAKFKLLNDFLKKIIYIYKYLTLITIIFPFQLKTLTPLK